MSDITFLLDFDGTVSRLDVGFSILNRFSTGSWRDIDEEFLQGKIGSPEAYRRIFRLIKVSKAELMKYVRSLDTIDPSFVEFYRIAEEKGWKLGVVSDGFGFYIRELLKKHGISDIPIYSNEVEYASGELKLLTPYSVDWCDECGTCKLNVVRSYKKDKNVIIYVGDGYSDRCAVEEADEVFSRRTLWRICIQKGIDSWYFRNFGDLLNILKGKKSLFIVDLDGTLIDSEKPVKLSYHHLAEFLGINPSQFGDLSQTIGLPLREVLLRAGVPGDRLEEAVSVFRKNYREVYLDLTEPLPYAEEFLNWAHSEGYAIVVLTNKHGDYARDIVSHFGWDKFIAGVFGEGDLPVLKPSPDAVFYVLERFGSSPSRCYYIGDSLYDQESAEKSGVEFIAVLTGYTEGEKFAGKKVRRITKNLKGVIHGFKILKRIGL